MEKTLVFGIYVGSEKHYTYKIWLQRNRVLKTLLNLVIQRLNSKYLKNGSWISKESMKRIGWLKV